MYWAEGDAQPDKFGSIPRATWWAIETLTTVGYGDAFPITPLGKALAGVIAILGVMLIALPTGLFAASFTEVLDRERTAAEAAKAPEGSEARASRKGRQGRDAMVVGAGDQALFEALRAWRAAEAKAQHVPPSVIFHDRTLAEIAAAKPGSRAALARLNA